MPNGRIVAHIGGTAQEANPQIKSGGQEAYLWIQAYNVAVQEKPAGKGTVN
jgi:hypothetical protein